MFAEFTVTARTPARAAASIWLRISASSGETITVGPAPAARSNAVATKYTADLPHPGALHDQRPAPLDDQGVDRGPLVVAQPRPGPREGAQHLFGVVAEVGVRALRRGHPPIVTPTPDNSVARVP